MNASRLFRLIGLVAAPAWAASVSVNNRAFTVPDGFHVELAAPSTLAPRPVSASLDDRGNLYVTDSSGSNEAPAEQLKHPNHRILRLDDHDGDGAYDTAVVFADQVMFPQGCLWHEGSVYVAAPPSIWKFTDTDGDGKADRREEWFKGGTLTGCANDIHGPHLGPDGYIYWTKGAFAEQTHTLGNGRVLKDKAAHIFRARPDGSDLDVVMSGGMDNPVEIAFTAEGETLFSSTFIDFTQPGFRDGLAHAIYGGVYGKVNDVLDDGHVIRTGPDLFHPFYEAGPSAECGLMRYTSAAFGVDYRDNLFATTFNLHKVTRHVLQPDGATFASINTNFLESSDTDFHPTDVLEDGDGSLLVVDTGGWYRLCCPSSQLAKPDVLGAVYRVRRDNVARPKDLWNPVPLPTGSDPAGFRSAADALANDSYPVREANSRWLVKSGEKALPALRQAVIDGPSWRQRQEALWAAFQIGTPAGHALLTDALRSTDPSLRRTAAKALSLHPDPNDTDRLLTLLDSEDSAVVRSAAEGLGRLRARAGVPVLLSATAKATDPFLEHSLIHSLILIASPGGTRTGLASAIPRTQRAALIALDQMESGGLGAADVVPFLNAPDERLRSAAQWILGRHPAWGAELAGWFRKRLTEPAPSPDALRTLDGQLTILTHDTGGQDLLADAVTGAGFQSGTRIAALKAMSGAGIKEADVPARWRTAVLLVLKGGNPAVAEGVQTARSMNSDPAVNDALRALALDSAQPEDLRLNALASLAPGRAMGPAEFSFLRTQLNPSYAPAVRAKAAGVIARARLDPAALQSLEADLRTAGPLELNLLLQAFDGGGDEALGQSLLAALQESKSARSLHPSQLKPHFAKFPEPVRTAADTYIASLNADAAQQSVRLDTMLAELKAANGDLRRGQGVFNGPKAACATCHRIGYLGGDVGPELTKIGEARSERDLLESIVYPSLSFVRSFEPSRVTLKAGDEINGIIRRETPDEITLVTGPGAEQRIRRDEIVEVQPGVISVMPGGLDEQLSRQELADLLTFVKTVRWR